MKTYFIKAQFDDAVVKHRNAVYRDVKAASEEEAHERVRKCLEAQGHKNIATFNYGK